MTEREQIEQQIRDVLASEAAAVVLSNKLFGPGGLFGRLAHTEAERRVVAQSPLFREAQRILSDLEDAEAEEFARVVKEAQAGLPQGDHLLRRERAEVT